MCGGIIEQPSLAMKPEEPVVQPEEQLVQPVEREVQSKVQAEPEPVRESQPTRTFVPAWGEQKAPRSAEIESISWDTKDFARPQKVEDIEMQWPEYTKHKLFSETESPKKTERPAAVEMPETPIITQDVPKEQPVYENKTEKPMSVRDAEALAAKYESAESSVAGIDTVSEEVQTVNKDDGAAKLPAEADIFNTSDKFSTEDKTKTIRVENLIPVQKEPERPMFYTFQTKTDEFQKLLDKEYERIHSMYGEDYDPMKGATVPPFEPEEKVQAQSLSDFERMLMEDVPEQAEQTAAQKFFNQSPAEASAEEEPIDFSSEEWNLSAEDPSRMTIEQIEDTIRQLENEEVHEEVQSTERKKRLAAMAAARDEYFRSLDKYDKKGRLIKKRNQEAEKNEPDFERRSSGLSAEELVELRDASEPADTIIRDTSKKAYNFAYDSESEKPASESGIKPAEAGIAAALAAGTVAAAAIPEKKTPDSYSPKSFDEIYQSIFGVKPVLSGNKEPEKPSVEPEVAEQPVEPEVVEPSVRPEVTGPSVRPEAAEPVAAPDIIDQDVIKPEKAEQVSTEYEKVEPVFVEPEKTEPVATKPEKVEPVITEPEKVEPVTAEPEISAPVTTEPSAEPSIRLTPEEEMARKLAELEKVYSLDEKPEAKTHNSPAISFFFDKETPPEILSAEELSNVHEIIEEKPIEKDDLTITNETSSLAFLYDDIPAESNAEVLTKEQIENSESSIPLDAAWEEIWGIPASETEPEAQKIKLDDLIEDTGLKEHPEIIEEQPVLSEDIKPQPEKVGAVIEDVKLPDGESVIQPEETVSAAWEMEPQAEEKQPETDETKIQPEESDVKIFKKSRHSEEADEEPESEPEDEREVTTSSHVILKIIAVLLVLCALFEGATLLLANIAPEAEITQSLLGVEESVVGSITSFFSGIFGKK